VGRGPASHGAHRGAAAGRREGHDGRDLRPHRINAAHILPAPRPFSGGAEPAAQPPLVALQMQVVLQGGTGKVRLHLDAPHKALV